MPVNARYGIDFVVIEKNEGVTKFSKAIGVQARTLEIYEQIDLAARAIEEGEIVTLFRWTRVCARSLKLTSLHCVLAA